MEKRAILEMQHITKRFPGVLALDDVSFQAYSGEILAPVSYTHLTLPTTERV